MVKLLSLTTSLLELEGLVTLLRKLYFSCQVDGLSLVLTAAEAELNANPWIHRRFDEYTSAPIEARPMTALEIVEAARRALLQERPDLVLFPAGSTLSNALHESLQQTGIAAYLVQPGQDAPLPALLETLAQRHRDGTPAEPPAVSPSHYLRQHQEQLERTFTGVVAPCLVAGPEAAVETLRALFPTREFHSEPVCEHYDLGLSLFSLSYQPCGEQLLELFQQRCQRAIVLEPVNTPLVGARTTFCYGDYDNEFSFHPATACLRGAVGRPHAARVWGHRSGNAAEQPLPNPDGCLPLFALTLGQTPACWTEPYRLPEGRRLKIVFADSGNVAGSVLHHARAVNSNTSSQAWAVALAPHPLIGAQHDDDETFFLQGTTTPSARLKQVLEEADCFVFFEDDDEHSPNWPFPLHRYVEGKAVLHLYIGYRVHRRSAKLMRSGRTILTPLPHILKMYPQAAFYAGFPPHELLEIPLVAPRSAQDGVCRILHSPSVPHWTTARYPYHKDTELFLRAARSLKTKYGSKVEFHQVGGWSQKDVVLARQVCDITFNQLRGFHGLSGDEAMLLERPCVQAFDQSNINRHREYWGLDAQFPWLATDRDNLETTLAELIDSAERRREIGRASRRFMLKYFSPPKGILPLLFHCYSGVSRGTEGSIE